MQARPSTDFQESDNQVTAHSLSCYLPRTKKSAKLCTWIDKVAVMMMMTTKALTMDYLTTLLGKLWHYPHFQKEN